MPITFYVTDQKIQQQSAKIWDDLLHKAQTDADVCVLETPLDCLSSLDDDTHGYTVHHLLRLPVAAPQLLLRLFDHGQTRFISQWLKEHVEALLDRPSTEYVAAATRFPDEHDIDGYLHDAMQSSKEHVAQTMRQLEASSSKVEFEALLNKLFKETPDMLAVPPLLNLLFHAVSSRNLAQKNIVVFCSQHVAQHCKQALDNETHLPVQTRVRYPSRHLRA